MESKQKKESLSPSTFYRKIRPEYFSDSKNVSASELPREVFAYELSLITKNLKTEQFETFCRRLAEKLIAPNLIPQVGPTGGGDGKTDAETYPVSESISDRWFIPENGWTKDEKWALAISAKETWKSKAQSDVKGIVGTGREFTKIYFITNQKPSSRERKEAQDELTKGHKVEVIILDGEWILENVYNNNLTDLAVDTLNLSETFKKEVVQAGPNDVIRRERLEELEKAIANPNRYFEYDHQLVDDALESAQIARMLELPRREVEGKFDRAVRFGKKVGSKKQLLRIHYQKAWTLVNWYDDYAGFIEEYRICKSLIDEESHIAEVELIANLINVLYGISGAGVVDFPTLGLEIKEESEYLRNLLSRYAADSTRPSASLIAKTQMALLRLFDSKPDNVPVDEIVQNLTDCLRASTGLLDFPFEKYKPIIEHLGDIFAASTKYDELIDLLAELSEKRTSELASGHTFLNRGFQKLKAQLHKDAVTYFGKAVRKLAKDESQNATYVCLRGLANSYLNIGLRWASYNCQLAALSISLRDWFQHNMINERSYSCAKALAEHELLSGRLPCFLNWHELLAVLTQQLDEEKDEEIPFSRFRDMCLAVSILNAKSSGDSYFQKLPDLLDEQLLGVSWLACQYRLGNLDIIKADLAEENIKSDREIEDFFSNLGSQPFRDQIRGDLNFMAEKVKITSNVLGSSLVLEVDHDAELIIASEMILAYLEGFLATAFDGMYPHAEEMQLRVSKVDSGAFIQIQKDDDSGHTLSINTTVSDKANVSRSLLEVVVLFLTKNFFIDNVEQRLKDIFETEQVHERLSLVTEHITFTRNTLGNEPKLLFENWRKPNHKVYSLTRPGSLTFQTKAPKPGAKEEERSKSQQHDNVKIASIINNELWSIAGWAGFGVFPLDKGRMGVFLAFENIEAGKKIFEEWRKRFGPEDKDEAIRLSVVKGVSEKNPYRYRVHITREIDTSNMDEGIHYTISKFHELNADNDSNVTKLQLWFNRLKVYTLIPARIDRKTMGVVPFEELGIIKRKLVIRQAWEISRNDVDAAVIRSNDIPVVPTGQKVVPVFEVIEWKKELKKRNRS